jgi:uncharacterized membrane protein YhfC
MTESVGLGVRMMVSVSAAEGMSGIFALMLCYGFIWFYRKESELAGAVCNVGASSGVVVVVASKKLVRVSVSVRELIFNYGICLS